RAGLAAGLDNAGEAILNLRKLATLPRPPGFFDPANPGELPPEAPAPEKDKSEAADATPAGKDEASEKAKPPAGEERAPLLSFSNTDMAFSGDVLVAGNYHGFNVYRLGKDGIPALLSSVVCPGGQGDVSIVGNLLIMSVEQTRGRVDCGLQGVDQDVSPERFRGLRIFDISDLRRPVQVGAVQTCRGSHTHSVVSGPGKDGKIIVYNSGISDVRKTEELSRCIDELPGDRRTALFRIDVIEIPVADPSKARIVDSPAVFADAEAGELAGLWRGGRHGEDTQETERTDHCHDITVFPARKIAAGACSGNGILFDISDPLKPKRMHEVVDKGFAYWHSATFNNDGTKVIFTDEWGGGMQPHCRAHDPRNWGANAIYDIVDGKLEFRSYSKIPAPQADQENCVAHNGSIVPVPGRDVFVQAWYQGGLSLIDFTDSAKPLEIGYFDRGPIDKEHLVLGGYWSVYWYGGRVYGTEIVRGLDIFELVPSKMLSANEVTAARLANQGAVFNPQQQFPVSWPAEPAVARAYLDQSGRAKAVEAGLAARISTAVDEVEKSLARGRPDRGLARQLQALAKELGTGGDASHQAALAEILGGLAERVGKQRG
ncbi:MAG: LVIVD repeat-containing protein, partial [Gammaproteobacteria bacterium]